ncbi:MAG: antibiotic biosynthesis monooxygenase [Geodermatophilaceae bacterium]
MLAVNRLHAYGDGEEQITGELALLIDVFATLPGFQRARAGRCLDEPDVWILLTEWESVGTYRRALSSHVVKTNGQPVFVRVVDEPGAYDVFLAVG